MISRNAAFAAFPSVIGGPGSDFLSDRRPSPRWRHRCSRTTVLRMKRQSAVSEPPLKRCAQRPRLLLTAAVAYRIIGIALEGDFPLTRRRQFVPDFVLEGGGFKPSVRA
jgi:hypothetical protein